MVMVHDVLMFVDKQLYTNYLMDKDTNISWFTITIVESGHGLWSMISNKVTMMVVDK